jgi:hypothetical protein
MCLSTNERHHNDPPPTNNKHDKKKNEKKKSIIPEQGSYSPALQPGLSSSPTGVSSVSSRVAEQEVEPLLLYLPLAHAVQEDEASTEL